MTIRAPYKSLHRVAYKEFCYEREVFFETVGACWALSARNVSGMFPIQLQMDLSKIELLYGVPSVKLPADLFQSLTNLFQARPRQISLKRNKLLENNAMELMRSMNDADFLSFSMGFQDAVTQVLEPLEPWNSSCHQTYMALKFFGLTLIEHGLTNPSHRSIYADLLVEYILISQNAFALQKKTSFFNH